MSRLWPLFFSLPASVAEDVAFAAKELVFCGTCRGAKNKLAYCPRCMMSALASGDMSTFRPAYYVSPTTHEMFNRYMRRSDVPPEVLEEWDRCCSALPHFYLRLPASLPKQLNLGVNNPIIVKHRRTKYASLASATSQVRLFALHPGKGDDQIQGELMVKSLDEDIAFEALSYSFAPGPKDRSMRINEEDFLERSDMLAALNHLRYPDQFRYLWIDSLCINQDDASEKAQQVKLMRLIYAKATRVLIWLGVATNDSHIAMNLIRRGSFYDTPLSIRESRIALAHLQVAELSKGPTEEEARALYCLLRRRWWTRLWCALEVALAQQDPVILCGTQEAPWSAYASIVVETQKEPDFQLGPFQTFVWEELRNCREFVFRRHRFQRVGTQILLGSLLRQSVNLHTTEPCDKVYALVHLTGNNDDTRRLSREQSPSRLFIKTMRHLIYQESSFDVLAFARGVHRSMFAQTKSIPSWVSDWSSGSIGPKPLWRRGLYKACRGPVILCGPEDHRELQVPGLRLDKIAYISDVIGSGAYNLSLRDQFKPIIRKLEAWLIRVIESLDAKVNPMNPRSPLRMYPKSSTLKPADEEAFWRTLLGNRLRIADGEYLAPAPPICGYLYQILRDGTAQKEEDNAVDAPNEHDNEHDVEDDRGYDVDADRSRDSDGSAVPPTPCQDSFPHIEWPESSKRFATSTTNTALHSRTFSQSTQSTYNQWQEAGSSRTRLSYDTANTSLASFAMPKLRAESLELSTYINIVARNMAILLQRRMFVTKTGYIGLAGRYVSVGDQVVLLSGADMPYVLREDPEEPSLFRLVSESYVHGVMHGEKLTELAHARREVQLETFGIV